MKVMIADDHPAIRVGLVNILAKNPDIELVGEAANGLELMELLESTTPDIIVMDINMPEMDGLESTKQITRQYPEISVLVLTGHDDKSYVSELLQAGASGYLLKNSAPEELLTAIYELQQGNMYLASAVTRDALAALQNKVHQVKLLTIREKEILQLVAKGLRNKEIAEKLFLSTETIKKHVSNIFNKLKVDSRVRLIAAAKDLGII